MAEVDDQSQDNMVLRELQRGYMLKGSLLRPARVVVGTFATPGTPAAGQAPQSPPDPPTAAAPPGPSAAPQPEEPDPWENEGLSADGLKLSEDGLDFRKKNR